MIASATVLSPTALARVAERHIRQHGPTDAEDLVDHVTLAAGMDRERALTGVRLAITQRRLMLDRDATLRTP